MHFYDKTTAENLGTTIPLSAQNFGETLERKLEIICLIEFMSIILRIKDFILNP